MLVEIKKMEKEEVAVVTSLDVAETFGKTIKEFCKTLGNLGVVKNLMGTISCLSLIRIA